MVRRCRRARGALAQASRLGGAAVAALERDRLGGDRRCGGVRLVYVEPIVIGRICLWCTSVHVLVIGLFPRS